MVGQIGMGVCNLGLTRREWQPIKNMASEGKRVDSSRTTPSHLMTCRLSTRKETLEALAANPRVDQVRIGKESEPGTPDGQEAS